MASTELRDTLSCARARAFRMPPAVSSPFQLRGCCVSGPAGRPVPVVVDSPSSRPGVCCCRLTSCVAAATKTNIPTSL
eukprot:188469-Pyramimonas_sp.AAC.1